MRALYSWKLSRGSSCGRVGVTSYFNTAKRFWMLLASCFEFTRAVNISLGSY